VVDFSSSIMELPLASPALTRQRGSEVSELTLVELAQRGFGKAAPVLPRQTLLAELYSRLARALILPLLPLLAVPFGLSAKRAGSGSAMVVAGLLLFVFETSLIFGQGLASAARLPAALTIGLPVALFVGACAATWVSSRRTPGENPVSWIAEHIAEVFAAIAKAARLGRAARP
jgi:lipopolysaccharide export system permease protein